MKKVQQIQGIIEGVLKKLTKDEQILQENTLFSVKFTQQ